MMGFVGAVRACLARYAVFSGRARRPEYWWFLLFTLLVGLLASLIDAALGAHGDDAGPIASLSALLLALPTLAVTWRRLHDVGRTGWVFFLPTLILIIGFIVTGAVANYFGQTEFSGSISLAPDQPSRTESVWPLIGVAAPLFLWGAANVVLFFWLASRSQPGENRFGPEPPAA